MRFCLVTREYPALGSHGGIGTYTQNLARGLAARGHHITVIARASEPTAPFFEGGVAIEPVYTPERWRLPVGNRFVGVSMRLLPFAIAAARRFRELDRECPQDLVEIPEYEGWGLGVALAARCPVVVRLHSHSRLVRRLNASKATLESRWIAGLEALSVRAGQAVLANSDALAAAMCEDYGFPRERVEVLPLGIDTARFTPSSPQWLRRHLALSDDAQVLLYVGRLERRKGVETLIEAFGRLRDHRPKAVLVMAGFSTDTGPEQRDLLSVLRARAEALGVAGRIHFLGHVPYDSLPLYYTGCDAFVAPSLYEPFGMVYLEAMACARPVIGCRSGGVPEIVKHGESGLLVPPGDVDALTQAILEVLDSPERARALGERARATAIADFSLDTIARRTEARYQGLIDLHHARERKEALSHAP